MMSMITFYSARLRLRRGISTFSTIRVALRTTGSSKDILTLTTSTIFGELYKTGSFALRCVLVFRRAAVRVWANVTIPWRWCLWSDGHIQQTLPSPVMNCMQFSRIFSTVYRGQQITAQVALLDELIYTQTSLIFNIILLSQKEDIPNWCTKLLELQSEHHFLKPDRNYGS